MHHDEDEMTVDERRFGLELVLRGFGYIQTHTYICGVLHTKVEEAGQAQLDSIMEEHSNATYPDI